MEVAKTTPQGHMSERIVVQTEDVPVPQILKEVVEVVKAVKIVPQERISAKICEQIVDAPVPHAVDEPVSQFLEETDEVIKLSPAERTPRRIMQGSPSSPPPPPPRNASRSVYTNRLSINQVTKHAEIPQNMYVDTVVDMLVVMQRQVPQDSDGVEDRGNPAGAVRASLEAERDSLLKLIEHMTEQGFGGASHHGR